MSDSNQAISGWPFLFQVCFRSSSPVILAESCKIVGNAGVRCPAMLFTVLTLRISLPIRRCQSYGFLFVERTAAIVI